MREIRFCYDALGVSVLVLADGDLDAICHGVDLYDVLDEKLDG